MRRRKATPPPLVKPPKAGDARTKAQPLDGLSPLCYSAFVSLEIHKQNNQQRRGIDKWIG